MVKRENIKRAENKIFKMNNHNKKLVKQLQVMANFPIWGCFKKYFPRWGSFIIISGRGYFLT